MPLDTKEYGQDGVYCCWPIPRIYRTPLVLGTSLVPVLSIAFLNATANALKALSALKEKVEVEHFTIR